MKWVINIPVWGPRYRQMFLRVGLPAIRAAMYHARIEGSARFIVHTDDRETIIRQLWSMGSEVPDVHPVPEGRNSAEKLGHATRIALERAKDGECILFLNSDLVISRETFAACERRFNEGKLFVTCHSVRTEDDELPPVGMSARALLGWGWQHHHPWVDDCILNEGRVGGPAIVVFVNPGGKSVVVHCFSLQCLAVRKSRHVEFKGPTADEMVNCFTEKEVHVVQDADELACVEPCSPDMKYGTLKTGVLTKQKIVEFAPSYASEMMSWQFSKQIVVCGEAMPWAQATADEILSRIDRRIVPYRLQRAQRAEQARNVSLASRN